MATGPLLKRNVGGLLLNLVHPDHPVENVRRFGNSVAALAFFGQDYRD